MRTFCLLAVTLLSASNVPAASGVEVVLSTEITAQISDQVVSAVYDFKVILPTDDESVCIKASFVRPLNAWSLEVLEGQSRISVADLANAIEAVLQKLPEENRRVSSITTHTLAVELLAEEFELKLRNSLDGMIGNVEPKSKAMFLILRDFYQKSPEIVLLKEKIATLSKLRVDAILPGSEIDFQESVVGRPWSELHNTRMFAFVPEPSFVMAIDNKNGN